jgi:bacteriocin-like protein
MKQRATQAMMHTSEDPISAGTDGSQALLEQQLTEAELEQISGGVFVSSALPGKRRPPATQWSGTPYQPEEDVEAY